MTSDGFGLRRCACGESAGSNQPAHSREKAVQHGTGLWDVGKDHVLRVAISATGQGQRCPEGRLIAVAERYPPVEQCSMQTDSGHAENPAFVFLGPRVKGLGIGYWAQIAHHPHLVTMGTVILPEYV